MEQEDENKTPYAQGDSEDEKWNIAVLAKERLLGKGSRGEANADKGVCDTSVHVQRRAWWWSLRVQSVWCIAINGSCKSCRMVEIYGMKVT